MKKILNIVSVASIIIFMILFVLKFFDVLKDINTYDFRSTFVIIFFVTRTFYLQEEVRDKDAEIEDLKSKLKNKGSR